MRLPILAYGHSILKQQCVNIDREYPDLQQLIKDMWETMYNANGCGLAAPQIGKAIRLFIVSSAEEGITETFINANIIEYSDYCQEEEEGCLSIPGLYEKIKRSRTITIEYYDRNFSKQVKTFSGAIAIMIQHEYDHTEGILYLDYLKPLAKRLMESKLKKIMKGQLSTAYPMKFI